jgi:hypothetical protein
LSPRLSMRGDVGTKNFFDLKSKVSFITDRLRQSCTACSAWSGSATSDVWVTSLQWEGEIGR